MRWPQELPVAGFSVTIPHKQKIMRYLDVVDPLARRIGAVNTVWRKAGKWRGANTDAAGVTVPLSRHLRLSQILRAVGGQRRRGPRRGVRAWWTAAPRFPWWAAIRTACARWPNPAAPSRCSSEQLDKRKFDAVVHATPLGMFPHADECFFQDAIPAELVFDMVYNPLETALLRRAAEQGQTVIPGCEMFLEQAVRQFEIWTGETAPRAVMEKAAMEALAAD